MNYQRKRLRSALVRCLAAGGLTLVAVGCRTTTTFERATATTAPPRTEACVLQVGDEVDIKFYYAPELNELGQTVRPDGKISLQLVGEVQVAGLTPAGLESALKNKYHGLIDKNEITVIARSFSHRLVYVGGAVQRPQPVPLVGSMTALSAILCAGGEDAETAAMGEVVVLRLEGGTYRGYAVDLKGTLTGRNPVPFYLVAGDIVYVSRRRISDINQWIDQHINRMIPQLGITGLRQSGNTTYGIDMSN